MKMKLNKNELIFVIAVFICSILYVNGKSIGNNLQNVTALLWIIYSLTQKRQYKYKKVAWFNFEISVIPIFTMMFYTCVLWLLKPPLGAGTTFSYFTRMLSTNTYLIIQMLFACTSFAMFGLSTINLIWSGLILNYLFISIIPALIFCGPIDIFKYLTLSDDITMVNDYLEVHDVTFAFGILFIYFFIVGYKHRTHDNIIKMILTAVFIYMGYKRIEIAAVLLVLCYYYFVDVHFRDVKKKTAVITSIILACSLIFVWSIYSGALDYISIRHGIEFNYRLDTWAYWARRTSFGLNFPGLGVNFVDKDTFLLYQKSGMIQNGYVLLAGMHGDLYKKYVELGFVGFSLWIIYFLYIKTTKLNKRFGKWSADIYLITTLYIIILYLTDNVYNYFTTNVCYHVIPNIIFIKICKSNVVQDGMALIEK